MSYARKSDFSRICTECENHSERSGQHMCNAQRSLIGGRQITTMCTTQRASAGACGPDGYRYVAKEVVKKPSRTRLTVAAGE